MSTDLITRCPSCGYRHEATSQIREAGEDEARPHAGAVSVCIACGEFGIFEDDFVGLRIRLPTDEEKEQLAADEKLQKVREAWRTVNALHPHAWPGRK